MYGEAKTIFCTGPTRAAKTGQKSLVPALYKPNEPTKEETLSFVLFESKFSSVSTVSQQGPPFSMYCSLPGRNLVKMNQDVLNKMNL